MIVVFGVACAISCRKFIQAVRLVLIRSAFIGWWTDRHASRRIPFIAGLVVLVGSALLMWLAKPIWTQIISRVGQGLADALIYIVGMTIILDTVTTKHVAEYMGYLAIALNVGTFAGPLLGGVVFDKGGYHAVWWMMMGFVSLDVILRLIMLENKAIDRSAVSESQQELALYSGQSNQGEIMKPSPTADSTLLPSVDDCVVCQKHPDLRRLETAISRLPNILYLLTSMRMDVALLGICVQAMVFSGYETVLSLYVQEIWSYNSLGAGLIFIPLTIPAFFAPLLGKVIDRTTPRWALVAGFLGMCPVLILTRLVTHDSIQQKVLMCFLLVLIGVGITATLNPLMAEISYVVEELEKREPERYRTGYGGGAYGQGYGLFAFAWSIGNVVGPLMCGLIKDNAGWGTMCWSIGLLSGLTALPCYVWSGEGSSWVKAILKHGRHSND